MLKEILYFQEDYFYSVVVYLHNGEYLRVTSEVGAVKCRKITKDEVKEIIKDLLRNLPKCEVDPKETNIGFASINGENVDGDVFCFEILDHDLIAEMGLEDAMKPEALKSLVVKEQRK